MAPKRKYGATKYFIQTLLCYNIGIGTRFRNCLFWAIVSRIVEPKRNTCPRFIDGTIRLKANRGPRFFILFFI